jgi:Ca2+-binding EF-hand superfamily protein
MLNESDVWQACKSISTDITEQQAYELFRILDVNKNGVVSLEEWNQVIKFDSNALLAKIIGHIQS